MPPPTIAPMPTMAKAGRLTGRPGSTVPTTDAKAAPSAAPMNSDGEKIPPDDPDPRLTEVANSLADEQDQQEAGAGDLVPQRCLDRRVADALDIVVPVCDPQPIHQSADEQHSDGVAEVAARDQVEAVFNPVQAPDEPRRGDPGHGTEHGIEQQDQDGRARLFGSGSQTGRAR